MGANQRWAGAKKKNRKEDQSPGTSGKRGAGEGRGVLLPPELFIY